jgi:hypothetical protein
MTQAAEQLPATVTAFIDDVARQTRLRRRERREVHRELVSHFAEAIDAGTPASEAISAFGDPRQAARQLRDAAIAKRTALDRALTRTARVAAGLALALVVVYAAAAAKLHLTKPVIAIDPIERTRAMLPVPATPEDAAWPKYREAMTALGLAVGDKDADSPGRLAVDATPLPGSAEWPAATEWLDAHQPALSELRDASRRKVFGYPIAQQLGAEDRAFLGESTADAMRILIARKNDPTTFPMLAILLPQLSKARAAARMLVVDAMHAAEKGDGERFVSDIEAAIRLSCHVQEGRITIGDLVAIAIRNLAVKRTIAALEWKPDLLDADQLLRLQRTFESLPRALRRMDLTTERLMWADILQRCYTDDGDGNGTFRLDRAALLPLLQSSESVSASGGKQGPSGWRPTVDPMFAATLLSGPIAAMTVADRRETREFVDTWMRRAEEASTLPLRDRAKLAALREEFHKEVDSRPARLLLPKLLLPGLMQAAANFAADDANLVAAATACAALRYRLDHAGSWPTRAEDLAPAYLAAVPEDPWSGSPVRLSSGPSGLRIWSVGEDGSDDGGDPDASDGLERNHGYAASTIHFRDDYRDRLQGWDGPTTKIDWVWFAPRGNFDRWKPREARW